MKFDVVVGNPPYQNDKAATGRKTATKPLWIKFVEHAQQLTSENGVIAFVTPTTWLSRGTNANKLLQKVNIDYVKVYTRTSPFKNVGTTTSWWITGNSNVTIITDEFENSKQFDITDSFFPTKTKDLLVALSVFDKTFDVSDKLDVHTSMKYHNEKKHLVQSSANNDFCYPIFHTNTTTKWTNLFDSDLMNKHKVILSKTGSTRQAFVDYKSSVSNLGVAILANTKKEAIILLSVLTSKLYKFLLESNRHSSTITTPVFKSLPSVDLSRSWSDNELYKHFKLTKEEIQLIEDTMNMKGVDVERVHFATPCPIKARVAGNILPKANIHTYDNVITKEDVGDMKFDVVVGNPPYQDMDNLNTKNIWPKFLKHGFDVCASGGYVSFITPNTWSTNKTYKEIFLKYDPIHINLDECRRFFPGVGSTFSYYIIRNQPPSTHNIEIVSLTGVTHLNNLPSIGLGVSDPIGLGIMNKIQQADKFSPYTSYKYHTDLFSKKSDKVSKVKTRKHNISVLHKRSAKGEDTIFYASEVDPKQEDVIRVSFSKWEARWNDMFVNDSIITCHHFIHIPVNTLDEARILKDVLLSKLYVYILKATGSGNSLSMNSTANFPAVDLSRSWSDNELYKHFNLTKEEIQLIEETIK